MKGGRFHFSSATPPATANNCMCNCFIVVLVLSNATKIVALPLARLCLGEADCMGCGNLVAAATAQVAISF